jgi:hypothetical protein
MQLGNMFVHLVRGQLVIPLKFRGVRK